MAVMTTRRVACPRCDTAITGDFKFCPTCAFRLRAGEPAPEPPAVRAPRWMHLLVVAGAAGLVVGFLGLGVLLLAGRDRGREPASTQVPVGEDRAPLTVDEDLADLLVPLRAGTALYWPPNDEESLPVHVGKMRFTRTEITRGMYAECLRDMEAHPDRVSPLHEALWRPVDPDPMVIAYAEENIDIWWDLFSAYEEERTGRRPRRPLDLHVPLPQHYGIVLMIPPSWAYLDAYEIIQWELPDDTHNLPITEVSWFDAAVFAEWASERIGIQLRLPVLGEWLRAGNGGDPKNLYPWGDAPLRYACNNLNFWGGEGEPRLHRVDRVYSDADGHTAEGLWGMSGNAREWTYNQELLRVDGNFFVLRWIEQMEAQQLEAPTAGGSFREGIQDCTVGWGSVQRRDKRGRWDDVGFRLMAGWSGV